MKYSKQLLLWAAVMSLAIPTIGFSADETPSYTNAAQAMHASNLADAAARNPDPATETAALDLRNARQDYDSINADPDASEEDKDIAFNTLETARENYTGEIERLTGLASENIQDMRDDGMGWGQIANELGVHPGTLGLGHTKNNSIDPLAIDDGDFQFSDNEIANATKRDTKQGWSKNHTTTTASTKNNKKGSDLSTGSTKNSKKGSDLSTGRTKNSAPGTNKNNSASNSNSGKSQSSKSNNGKGNSKNK